MNGIDAHFGTAPLTHPVFGALIARQLEQFWRLLGEPPVFHVIEVGSGDGAMAQSIAASSPRMDPRFARAIYYVPTDYQPLWRADRGISWGQTVASEGLAAEAHVEVQIQRVKSDGLRAFRNVVGCILTNELLDNFPVHRFAVQGGRIKEGYVTLIDGHFAEILDEPSTPRIQERLEMLAIPLPEGFRGEVSLGVDDWTRQLCATLDRGFVLTIDYGDLASDLYSNDRSHGNIVCYRHHATGTDPYQRVGMQDITAMVDFTSLMRLGTRHGLNTVGYTTQARFLTSLGLPAFLDAVDSQGMSFARAQLTRMAMSALVDPDDYGDFKVLAQAKGVATPSALMGFQA